MKKITKHILLASLLLCGAACQQDDTASEGEGAIDIRVSLSQPGDTRAEVTPSDPMIRIYRADGGLIRRYTSTADVPSPLYLVAGDYKVTVEAGDRSNTAFTCTSDEEIWANLCYYGETPFRITAHKTATATVIGKPINCGARLVFDRAAVNSENSNITDVRIDIAAMEMELPASQKTPQEMSAAAAAFDEALAAAAAPHLSFTGAGEHLGYFICPEEVTSLVWHFSGTHAIWGHFDKVGCIENVRGGYLYTVRFKYSKLPDGSLGISISVDENTEIIPSQFIFKPQPELTGDGLDLSAVNPYTEGESVRLTCTSIVEMGKITLDGVTVYEAGSAAAAPGAGVTVEKESASKVHLTLAPAWFANYGGGIHSIPVDIDGTSFTYRFAKQGLAEATGADCDLWRNTARLQAYVTDPAATEVKIRYRRQGTSAWAEATATKGSDGFTYTATTTAAWTEGTNAGGHTIWTPDTDRSIFAGNTYEYQLVVNGTAQAETRTVTPTTTQSIPYGDMEDTSLSCWGTGNSNAPYWGSGNNSFSGGAGALCAQNTRSGMEGAHCAHLKARNAAGNLAAGNLFLGTFTFNLPNGTVGFGQEYAWEARPKSLKLKYWAQVGTVTKTDANKGIQLPAGEPDQASILVAIVDWDSRHGVTSGLNACSGVWSPEDGSNPTDSEGNKVGTVIGYGAFYPTGTTSGDSMIELEIPIHYYDKTAKPGKQYTLVIGCSTSRYGDYMNGNETNQLYVDDFRWGY